MSEQEAQVAPKPKLSATLRTISQLLMNGFYPGSHAPIVAQSIRVLETLATSEEKKEAEREEAKLEIVKEEEVHVQDGV